MVPMHSIPQLQAANVAKHELPMSQASCEALNDTSERSAMLVGIGIMLRLLALQGIEPEHDTPFMGKRVPSMDLLEYLKRLRKFFSCSNTCFVVAFIYICRIAAGRPPHQNGIPVHPRSYHRLFVTSLIVAAKYYEDINYDNSTYASVGGLKTQELNILEKLFVQQLGWKLRVSAEEYELYSDLIQNAAHAEKSMMI